MSRFILVTSLRIEAASGPTCYVGENGFSAVQARLGTDDPHTSTVLDQHVRSGELLTVRCGLLEVRGRLLDEASGAPNKEYRMGLEGVHYGPPESAGNGA